MKFYFVYFSEVLGSESCKATMSLISGLLVDYSQFFFGCWLAY